MALGVLRSLNRSFTLSTSSVTNWGFRQISHLGFAWKKNWAAQNKERCSKCGAFRSRLNNRLYWVWPVLLYSEWCWAYIEPHGEWSAITRAFSVNPEAANNKTLYYIFRCSLLQVVLLVLYLVWFLLQRKYIKNNSGRIIRSTIMKPITKQHHIS